MASPGSFGNIDYEYWKAAEKAQAEGRADAFYAAYPQNIYGVPQQMGAGGTTPYAPRPPALQQEIDYAFGQGPPPAPPAPAPAAPAAPPGPPPPAPTQPPPGAGFNPGGTMPTPIAGQPPPAGNTQGYYFTLSTPTGPANFWLPAGNVPSDIAQYYFRSDTPGGLSTEPVPPDVVERFRNYVASGYIIPTDQTAIDFVHSQGGFLPGDQTPLGPLIGGLPSGLTTEQWQIIIQQAQQELDRQEALGVFTNPDGTTMNSIDRDRLEAEIAAKIVEQETARLLAENQIKATDAQIRQADDELRQAQQRLDDARRAGDLDRAQQEEQYIRTLQLQRDQLGEQQRQFNEQLTLSQAQLTGFYNGAPTLEFQQYLAQASADPNRIVEAADLARMAGAARGGLPVGAQAGVPLAYTAQAGAMNLSGFGPANSGVPPGQPGQPGQKMGVPGGGTPAPGFTPLGPDGTPAAGVAGYGAGPLSVRGGSSSGPNTPNLYSGPAVGPGSPGTPAAPGTPPPAAGGTQVALSPEVIAYLSGQSTGQPLPQFGNPSGVQGQMMDLSQLLNTPQFSFRQTPAAYRALSPTSRTEVGALNRSVTGQRPEDWEQEIKRQLPQASGTTPAAYAF